MATDKFDYDSMVQKALRHVVRDALIFVEKKGLPGNHHFYITFRTDRADVHIPEYLRRKHPEEITIVLQHQYWDLKITETFFQVSLSFNDEHEILKVPFDALVSFMDPSVKFGLQFAPEQGPRFERPEGDGGGGNDPSSSGEGDTKVVTLDAFRKKKGK